MANEDSVRFNVVLSPELAAVIEEVAKSSHTSKTAVIRQAIALMKLAHDEKKKGKHLGFASSTSQLDTEIVGAF